MAGIFQGGLMYSENINQHDIKRSEKSPIFLIRNEIKQNPKTICMW